MPPIRVLFVCTANICRSPMAEGLFRHQVATKGLTDFFVIDSAGTDGFDNAPPDPTACETAARHGVSIQELRSREVVPSDLRRFDYIIAMTVVHQAALEMIRPADGKAAIHLLLRDFAPQTHLQGVPDPYHGPRENYDRVFGLLQQGVTGLLNFLQNRHPELKIDE